MPTDPDIARIAAGLTKAQRELLCDSNPRAVGWYKPRIRLEALGLLEHHRRTEEGEAVRAHLLASQTSGEGR